MSKNNSCGFRKGFLLAPSSKKNESKRKAHVTTSRVFNITNSSVLMDMEESAEVSMSSDLCIDSSSSQYPSKNHGVTHVFSNYSPLENQTSLVLPLGNDVDQCDIGMREITTEIFQDVRSEIVTHVIVNSSTTLNEGVDNNEPLSISTISLIDREFSRALWMLLKSSNPDQVAVQFQESCLMTSSHWKYAWTLVFGELVKTGSSSAAEIGYEMLLTNGIHLPAAFIVPCDDKESRVFAFGAAYFFEKVAQKCIGSNNDNILVDLLTIVYPGLLQTADGCSSTRSKLVQQVVNAAFTIVAVSSVRQSLRKEFIAALPGLDCLLAIQEKWIESSLLLTKDMIQTARKKCALGVLSDWRVVLKAQRIKEFKVFQQCKESWFGGLLQTVCSNPEKMTASDVINIISKANPCENSRCMVRGLAAWLGTSKRHLQEFKVANNNALVIDYLIKSLQYGYVDLTLATLGCIWSESSGRPPQEASKTTLLCLLIEIAMKREMVHEVDNLDTGTMSICALLAQLVLAGGLPTLENFIERSGDHIIKVQVISCILEAGQNSMVEHAASVLLGLVNCSPFLRRKMTNSKLFLHLSPEFLVPLLIDVACAVKSDPSKLTSEALDILAQTMTQQLEKCLTNSKIGNFIDAFVTKVLAIEFSSDSKATEICKLFASKWRNALIFHERNDHVPFCQLLDALAAAVLNSPSSLVLLALFGIFVGESADYDFESPNGRQCILIGVRSVVQLCTNRLHIVGGEKTNSDVFERLSPLLLLRRIPSYLFHAAWKFSLSDECLEKADTVLTLSSLASALVVRLSFKVSTVSISPEERQLSAQVAGHCLPFDMDENCSLFQRVCRPAFMRALNGNALFTVELLKHLKIVLYAVVHHMSVSVEPESNGGLSATIAFVVLICNMPQPMCESNAQQDLDELRTHGCVGLFARCFEQFFALNKSNFADVASSLRAILTDETPDLDWVRRLATNHFQVDKEVANTAELRSSLWHALLDVSRLCPEEEGLLKHWATSILPWVIRQATKTKSLDSKHPLCAANALQIVFVLIVRTKSLDIVEVTGSPPKGLRMIYNWALRSIEHPSLAHGSDAKTLIRTAGLKLLVAIFTIDQTGSNAACQLDALEVLRILEILESVTASDYEPEVQTIASQMLSTLHIRRQI